MLRKLKLGSGSWETEVGKLKLKLGNLQKRKDDVEEGADG